MVDSASASSPATHWPSDALVLKRTSSPCMQAASWVGVARLIHQIVRRVDGGAAAFDIGAGQPYMAI
jgi:hypothetical protein